jgi:glycosyltransferase involved in cell wall biosynthesis
MVTISCSGKLHAFALAEQMERQGMLDAFYTSYASQKNTFWHRLVKRTDKEQVPPAKIHTCISLAFPIKLWPAQAYTWNNLFDNWVKGPAKKNKSKIFIGWSGMSLQSIRAAKAGGKVTIVERGSSHILCQDKILKEEYAKFGIPFSIDQRVIDKELKEYQEADYISIPSGFVYKSFVEYGVNPAKLLQNPYGASQFFKPVTNDKAAPKNVFRIVYLGTLSVRKGVLYHFEALQSLQLPDASFEAWFIGSIDEDIKATVEKYKKDNWRFFGKINHYELAGYLSQCDVGIQPSLEEGLSMVIPQMMSCNLPVIITTNTGAEDIVQEGQSGFVVPIRDPGAIAKRITELYNDQAKLGAMKKAAGDVINKGYTWNDYGARYAANLEKIYNNR